MIRVPRFLFAAATASALVAMLVLSGCGDRASSPAAGTFTPRTPGVLTVVTSELPSAGFWEGTPERPTGGFEYELARDLARRFGLKGVRIELEHFHNIVVGKLDGADLALDLITPTSARSRYLAFSSPYLDAAPTVLVRSGTSVPDLATARTLRWGAVQGTTLADIIDSLISPTAPLRLFDSNAQMVAALQAREVDAVLLDMPLAVVTAGDSHGRLQAVAQLPQPESIAAALPKGSANVEAVDSAFRAFMSDGTIDRLLKTWVGADAADAEKMIPLLRSTR